MTDTELDSLFELIREETPEADAATIRRTQERVIATADGRASLSSLLQVAAAIALVTVGGSSAWALSAWAWPGEAPLGLEAGGSDSQSLGAASPRASFSRDPDLRPLTPPSNLCPPRHEDESVDLAPEPSSDEEEATSPKRHAPRTPRMVPPDRAPINGFQSTLDGEVEATEDLECDALPVGEDSGLFGDDTGLLTVVTLAEQRLYDEAHRLHYQKRDFQAALLAWQAYQSRFPSGHFVTEAQWGQADALLRVGRLADARPELEAIIRSERFDEPQKREARALLRAVDASLRANR